LVHRDLTG